MTELVLRTPVWGGSELFTLLESATSRTGRTGSRRVNLPVMGTGRSTPTSSPYGQGTRNYIPQRVRAGNLRQRESPFLLCPDQSRPSAVRPPPGGWVPRKNFDEIKWGTKVSEWGMNPGSQNPSTTDVDPSRSSGHCRVVEKDPSEREVVRKDPGSSRAVPTPEPEVGRPSSTLPHLSAHVSTPCPRAETDALTPRLRPEDRQQTPSPRPGGLGEDPPNAGPAGNAKDQRLLGRGWESRRKRWEDPRNPFEQGSTFAERKRSSAAPPRLPRLE